MVFEIRLNHVFRSIIVSSDDNVRLPLLHDVASFLANVLLVFGTFLPLGVHIELTDFTAFGKDGAQTALYTVRPRVSAVIRRNKQAFRQSLRNNRKKGCRCGREGQKGGAGNSDFFNIHRGYSVWLTADSLIK